MNPLAGQVAAAFAEITSKLGAPSLVVACAGTADVLGPVWSADPDEWWRAVSVDLRGTMLAAWSAIPSMLLAHNGRFVTVHGNLGDRQSGHVSAFAVAKAGIARLTVRTPMTEQLAFGDADRLAGGSSGWTTILVSCRNPASRTRTCGASA